MDLKFYENLTPHLQSQKPRYFSFLQSVLKPAFGLHGVLGSFQDAFDLDNASGEQLDMIGEIVGVSRILPFPISTPYEVYETVKDYVCNRVYMTSTIGGFYYDRYTGKYVEYNPVSFGIVGSESLNLSNGDIISVKMNRDLKSNDPPCNVCLSYTWSEDRDGEQIYHMQDYTAGYVNASDPAGTVLLKTGQTYFFEWNSGSFNLLNSEGTDMQVFKRRMDDEEYRLMIKARIAMNAWDGSNDSAEQIYKRVFGSTLDIRHQDNQDGTISLYIDGAGTSRQIEILNAVGNMLVPAGIAKTVNVYDTNVYAGLITDVAISGILTLENVNILEDD